MATVLRLHGFRFVIIPGDHNPPHVHVTYGGAEAKCDLDPIKWSVRRTLSDKDVAKAERIIIEHRAMLGAAWGKINAKR